jgi:transposase
MKLESLFHQLLGLGLNWEVISLRVLEPDGTVEIGIRETGELWKEQKCAVDGHALVGFDHAQERRWRHLNIFQYRCEIVCKLPRGKCVKCGKIRTISPPWEGLSKGFTLAFEAMCLLLMRDMPVNRVASFVGEHDTRLWRMLNRHVEKARKDKKMDNVTAICCDELSMRKGHQYASVFADAIRREVLFATESKENLTWMRFAEDLKAQGGKVESITWASIDMSKSYQSGARSYMPHAKIVFDKFHVIKLANDAVDQVRRLESKCNEQRTKEMKKSRYIWLKNPENLSEKQQEKLQSLNKLNLQTAKAYQMRLNLQEIYRLPDSFRAHQRLKAWIRWTRIAAAKNPLLAPMARVGRTLDKHRDGILAHWDDHATNAFMEGLMSVFSATKRKARGYRSFEYLRCMLYFTSSNLNIPFQPLYHCK